LPGRTLAVPADPVFRFNGGDAASTTVALAHGAGTGMAPAFLEFFARGLGALDGVQAVRFEFLYTAARRSTGKKKLPDREPVLRATWLAVIDLVRNEQLVIGGKSMGGRIASLVADEAGVAGLVCLGYPFHPVGKPDRLRVEYLKTLQTPTLIVQGEHDPFGSRDTNSRRCPGPEQVERRLLVSPTPREPAAGSVGELRRRDAAPSGLTSDHGMLLRGMAARTTAGSKRHATP
jgi:predicted alpha/beta-hydrolase family hydrolase